MFRIRRIYDDILPVNRKAIAEVREIFSEHFSGAPISDMDDPGVKLRNPFLNRFRMIFYVAENAKTHVCGFAIVLQEPTLRFSYPDDLASAGRATGRGVGAALYEHVREESTAIKSLGLFFECLPDAPTACADPVIRIQNPARLRFYEQYGARPIIGTAYETPLPGHSNDNVPHFVMDCIAGDEVMSVSYLKEVIRAILEKLDGTQYREALAVAIARIQEFQPLFLILALGLDPSRGDPTGTWSLVAKDLEENGQMIRGMDLPTVVIQEGGYRTRTLGKNASAFFHGLANR